jgi:hypothetical protein
MCGTYLSAIAANMPVSSIKIEATGLLSKKMHNGCQSGIA